MGLYERLLRIEEPRISVHQLRAVAAEWKRARLTNAQARTILSLTAAEATELQTLVNRIGTTGSSLTAQEIEDVLFLAERRIAPYDTVAAVKTRFGV
jgi:hypothetical protein